MDIAMRVEGEEARIEAYCCRGEHHVTGLLSLELLGLLIDELDDLREQLVVALSMAQTATRPTS